MDSPKSDYKSRFVEVGSPTTRNADFLQIKKKMRGSAVQLQANDLTQMSKTHTDTFRNTFQASVNVNRPFDPFVANNIRTTHWSTHDGPRSPQVNSSQNRADFLVHDLKAAQNKMPADRKSFMQSAHFKIGVSSP